jgi:CheY-like chemotaxis protein
MRRNFIMANIIVVDDEKIIRTLLKEILKKAGHEIRITKDGREALDLVNEKEPDLIITDIFMPGKSGLELIMELRKDRPAIRLIAISGDTASRAGGHIDCLGVARDLGCSHILVKPFSKDQVLDAVNAALNA